MAIREPETLEHLLRQAVQLAVDRVHAGGIPFAALVADARGRILGKGVNRVAEDGDPTAHAEIDAMRRAAVRLGRPDLGDTVLLASAEPCGMCYAVAASAGIPLVVFAADRDQAAAGGFDYRHTYRRLADDPAAWPFASRHCRIAEAMRPFEVWRARDPELEQ